LRFFVQDMINLLAKSNGLEIIQYGIMYWLGCVAPYDNLAQDIETARVIQYMFDYWSKLEWSNQTNVLWLLARIVEYIPFPQTLLAELLPTVRKSICNEEPVKVIQSIYYTAVAALYPQDTGFFALVQSANLDVLIFDCLNCTTFLSTFAPCYIGSLLLAYNICKISENMCLFLLNKNLLQCLVHLLKLSQSFSYYYHLQYYILKILGCILKYYKKLSPTQVQCLQEAVNLAKMVPADITLHRELQLALDMPKE